jgi:hypothetical protein
MGIRVFSLGLTFLMAAAAFAHPPTAGEEALRILGLGWGAGRHGGFGMWGIVPNCAYSLECRKQTYCAFLALFCDEMTADSGPVANGSFRATDKRKIPWECRSLDGKTGRVTIAGRQYDLVKGRLFLIAAQKDPVAIYQLDVDLARLSKESINQLVLARSKEQPEVMEALKVVWQKK